MTAITKALAAVSRFRGEAIYGVGTAMVSAVGLVSNLIAARHLSPSEMGIMQMLLLIPIYCSFFHLGVFNGLGRDIPFYTAQRDTGKVQGLIDSSWAVAKAVSTIGLVVGILLCLWFWRSQTNSLYAWGTIFVILALVLEPLAVHLEVVYASTCRFRELGVKLVWQNMLSLAASILPVIFGAAGFIVSRCVLTVARFVLRWHGAPLKARSKGSMKDAIDLSRTGMPLLVGGTLYTFLTVADRSVIAYFMTSEDMGHFALSGIVAAGTQFLPFCLAAVMYPRVSACYGEAGSARPLRRYFWLSLGVTSLAVVPVAVVGYFIIEPLTIRFLPKYAAGIPAAKLTCLSSMTLAYFGVTCIISVVRRNLPYIVAIVISLAVVWVFGAHFVQQGHGILGAVWARTIASALLCIFTVCFAFWLTLESKAADIGPIH